MADFGEKLWGKYKGYVRDTNDPERRGRIRCYCPQVMGEVDAEPLWLFWAEACLPSFSGGHGVDFAVPLSKADNGGVEVPVWLEFEGGHQDFPIWTGCAVYAPTTKDPSLVKAAVSDQKGTQGAGLFEVAAEAYQGGAVPSTAGTMNPPYAAPDQGDKVLMAKKGQRWVIGVEGGGMIVITEAGVDITGSLLRINGKTFLDSLTEIVGSLCPYASSRRTKSSPPAWCPARCPPSIFSRRSSSRSWVTS